MSKALGRVFGVGVASPYGYETDYMKYLRGYNSYNYEQTWRNTTANTANVLPDYQARNNNLFTTQPRSVYNFMEQHRDLFYQLGENDDLSSYYQDNNNGNRLVLQSDILTNQGMQYSQNNVSDINYTKPVDYSLYGDDFSKDFIDKMLNDAEFQRILNEYIIPNEGGYNNDPADIGGETNMGIAQKYHPNEDIKDMTRERANAIYYRDYYNWNGLNKLPYPIRGFVVDYGLPTYPQNALKTVHNILGIPKSATIIGPTTLGIFENYTDEDYNDFLEKYRAEMKKHFNEVTQKNPQKRKFLKGWLNRANRAHLAR